MCTFCGEFTVCAFYGSACTLKWFQIAAGGMYEPHGPRSTMHMDGRGQSPVVMYARDDESHCKRTRACVCVCATAIDDNDRGSRVATGHYRDGENERVSARQTMRTTRLRTHELNCNERTHTRRSHKTMSTKQSGFKNSRNGRKKTKTR